MPLTKRLNKINFTDNQITDIGMEDGFVALMNCAIAPPLTHIIFAQNMISNKGAEALFNALLLSSTIEFVSLADNRIDD